MTNPFTPTFGIVPPYLAGRNSVLADIRKAFINWPGDPNRSSIFIGPRGSGKTALLSCVGDVARQEGWIITDTIAGEGMLEDIFQRTLAVATEHISPKERTHLTGVTLGSFLGLTWSSESPEKSNWRSRMSELLTELNNREIGLLITVDEVRADITEMIQLASVYQLFLRENLKIAMVMAGLPFHVNQLISNESVSFLRRARQHYLGTIADSDIRFAFRKTVESAGKTIREDALDMAVAASGGFPYMMQLVGYSIWEESETDPEIDTVHAERGIRRARDDFRAGVLDSTFRELSKGDRKFLYAMLQDREYSSLSDIARRIGKTTGYASTYKNRLILAGVIEEQPGNTFAIAIPSFREYLIEKKEL